MKTNVDRWLGHIIDSLSDEDVKKLTDKLKEYVKEKLDE